MIVFVKATDDSENGVLPTAEALEAMGRFNDELTKAGVMRAGDFNGPRRVIMDGPFAETNEVVAGFWLWDVKDMDEAVAWVKRCPNPMPGPSEIEIRPLYEMADLQPHSDATGA